MYKILVFITIVLIAAVFIGINSAAEAPTPAEHIITVFNDNNLFRTGDNSFSPKDAYSKEQSILTFNRIKL